MYSGGGVGEGRATSNYYYCSNVRRSQATPTYAGRHKEITGLFGDRAQKCDSLRQL